jgi:iron only hydrogenase large subunit-like protein/uncharacterized Fe-S cluster-containing protein
MYWRGYDMSTIQFKEANCKNCYKCLRNCHIKAIAFKNEQARILEDDCILCGNCLHICPQNAKSVRSDIGKIKSFMQKNEKVYASIAPSFISAFEVSEPLKIISALKRLGFIQIQETAVGAAQVSKEYDKLLRKRKMPNIITTSCPSVNFLVQKYYPELISQLAPVVSPMIAHAKMLKAMYGPRIRVVFIGPCIAKKEECKDLQNEGVVDAVITFEELEKWFIEEGIGFDDDDAEENRGIKNAAARFYPAPGGIIKTLSAENKKNYKCISIDGVDRCIEILESIKSGEVNNFFIEMNACAGGCLRGPCIKPIKGGFLEARDRLVGYVKRSIKDADADIIQDAKVSLTKKFVDRSKSYKIPDDETIQSILNKIGKFSKDKELNCGACGYSTCREKAVAVYNNKAELHMCLPYMRERAESISNIIFECTPNALIALDLELKIQEFNVAAQSLLHLDNVDVRGKYIGEFLDCEDFQGIFEEEKDIVNKKVHYEKYDIIVEQSILKIPDHNLIVVVIKDITGEMKQQEQIFKVRADTIDIAQNVIDKQMRVAQEIASLLGETTAETKVALTKLKSSILWEMGENK